jgi:hypothetical protein
LKIDPWGVPFEDYDAGGRRKKEQATPDPPYRTKPK